jgi:hypothetical protein
LKRKKNDKNIPMYLGFIFPSLFFSIILQFFESTDIIPLHPPFPRGEEFSSLSKREVGRDLAFGFYKILLN